MATMNALMPYRSQSELASPQIGAVSGGLNPMPNYESYLESSASLLPAYAEADFARKAQQESLRLDREARAQASRDANIALGLKGTETALTLANNPIMQRWGTKVWNALQPKPSISAPGASDLLPAKGGTQVASAFPAGTVSDTGTLAWEQPLKPLAPGLDTVIPEGPSVAGAASGFKGVLSPLGEKAGLNPTMASGLSSLGTVAADYAIQKSGFGNAMHKAVGGGAKEWGDAASLGASFALGGPVGLLGTGIGIGVRELTKGKCIIWTAVCGEGSYELEICREFRDKYLDRKSLAAYYAIAEKVVPIIEANPEFKALVREWLVEPLTRVGAFKLGHTREHPSSRDCAITASFLELLKNVGSTIQHFTRENGEEVL
jgi:hypothetical protein